MSTEHGRNGTPEDGPAPDELALARALIARLATETGAVPTSALGRLGRTAGAFLRGGRAVLGRKDGAVDAAGVERLVRSLGELKGVAMKMGQILSYVDDAVPAETRALLGVLRTWSPATAFDRIEAILREDLGDRAAELQATLERTPASSASIGQVHRARLPDGTPVAVKVRHPGIDDAIRADFRAARAGTVLSALLAPGVNVKELIAEAQAGFLEECDYALEARRQRRFGELYARHDRLVIPAVHERFSSGRVLTTTWHDGATLEAFVAGAPPAATTAALGAALYEFYVGSLYRHGLFNADPHPGNLLFDDRGRVVVLDHGCVREFDDATVAALAALSRAVRLDARAAVRSALVQLGARDPGDGKRYDATRELLRAFYGPVLEPGSRTPSAGLSRSFAEVAATKRSILRMHLPGKLLFLFRIRFGLYAVLARLSAELDLQALEAALADTPRVS
ncbi:MAG: hypothetical protein IT373_32460 [Polyangiaceae bacterium]|nr:hypothetical protein [Polyangiaceae bacterium]